MTTEYIMVAALAADPTKHVYWPSLALPDFEGVFSGYLPSELILPAVVDYTLETQIVGAGNAIPPGVAGGDLDGTYPDPNVVGLQGRPISPAAPLNGAPLIWNQSQNQWNPGAPSSIFPQVIDQQYAAIIENPAGVPVFSRLTQDMILPSFIISLSGGGFLQVSQPLTNPGFSFSYNNSPTSTVLTDSDGNAPQTISPATLTSFNSVNSYTKNTFGATETFTVTANNGIIPKTATTTFEWVQFSYYGTGVAGGNNAAFIQALFTHFLTNTRSTTFSVNAAGGQYIYFACRAAYGTPTFLVGGFAGGFELVSNSISVTNGFGFVDTYQLWVSDNAGLGATTVTVQ